ncbi:hypothetical protein [Gramella sp. KN1008]|uniref:hypothetical protein n=1 Tax=Gramella sp. KN1008 TaxID=2529298 RepID=UPI00103DB9A5|nr:hypothetical protein [Gramella sp. KN1008]TBW25574.1 hypothetical protein EZJ28_15825 [Gramella sp. KN1008]
MKVFLPSDQKEFYPYIEEIRRFSKADFIFEKYSQIGNTCKLINVHWPEAIFNWEEPDTKQLNDLEKRILKWKSHAKLIYTKHDLARVKGTTPNFRRLFKIIEDNTDLFIHLGDYSKQLYREKFPKAEHKLIPHPALTNTFTKYSKEEARSKLGIAQDALVIVAPGKIRTFKERNLLLKSFQKLEREDKVLVSTNMRNEMKFDFKGRVRLQPIFDIQHYIKEKFRQKYQPPYYYFNYETLNNNDFSLRISAADIVFVPRIDLLNSGNVLLGLTFGKITVGPAIGNIQEQLTDHKLPVFNPNSISSVVNALEEGIEMHRKGIKPRLLDKYSPDNVAMKYDKNFKNLLNR